MRLDTMKEQEIKTRCETALEKLKALQDSGEFTELMVLQEEMKTMPFGDVYEEYLRLQNIKSNYFEEVKNYEEKVLVKRK